MRNQILPAKGYFAGRRNPSEVYLERKLDLSPVLSSIANLTVAIRIVYSIARHSKGVLVESVNEIRAEFNVSLIFTPWPAFD
jgi:hypothetical protein